MTTYCLTFRDFRVPNLQDASDEQVIQAESPHMEESSVVRSHREPQSREPLSPSLSCLLLKGEVANDY